MKIGIILTSICTLIMLAATAYVYLENHRTYCYGYYAGQCVYMTTEQFRQQADDKVKRINRPVKTDKALNNA